MMKKLYIYAAAALLAMAVAACDNKQSAQTDTAAVPAQSSSDVTPVAGQKPYVVDFYATWCGPCKQLKPFFRQMEQRYAMQADFASVDVDEQPDLAQSLRIDVVPTIIIFRDSTMSSELARVQGFSPQQLERAILDNI